MTSRSRWKCIVAFGSPVVPEVKPSSTTSSRPVSTASNRTGFLSATRSSSASWLAVPSKPTTLVRNADVFAQATRSSISRVSHRARPISALSTIWVSSPGRSIGIVFTTTAPAFTAARKHATIAGLLADRIRTRLPARTPYSSTRACAMRFDQSASSL
jgi:hypothetical protein